MKSGKGDGMYGFRCEYCDAGRVYEKICARELIPVSKEDFVALEQVPMGVCDHCHAKYYLGLVLRQADALWAKRRSRKLIVPVARYVPQRKLRAGARGKAQRRPGRVGP